MSIPFIISMLQIGLDLLLLAAAPAPLRRRRRARWPTGVARHGGCTYIHILIQILINNIFTRIFSYATSNTLKEFYLTNICPQIIFSSCSFWGGWVGLWNPPSYVGFCSLGLAMKQNHLKEKDAVENEIIVTARECIQLALSAGKWSFMWKSCFCAETLARNFKTVLLVGKMQLLWKCIV